MEEAKHKRKKHPIRNLLLALGIFSYIIAIVVGVGLFTYKIILPELKTISIEEVKASVVMINIYDENNKLLGQGSGFSFQESNKIITNFHVLEGAKRIDILTDDGRTITAEEILVFDKKNDLAIIEGDFDLKPLTPILFFDPIEEEYIATISSPGGAFNTISEGKVSVIYDNALEMIVSIKPGSSGGAVINEKGRVVGVIVANIDIKNNVNLAISINVANKLYEDFQAKKYAEIKDDSETIKSFMPDIFDDKDGNELEIKDIWIKNRVMLYRPESLSVFNNLTSRYTIFSRIISELNDGFSNIYNELDNQKKIIATDYYLYLRAYDQWWFSEDNDEFDETVNLRKENPLEWDNEQLLIDLGVLKRHQIAIIGARAEDIIYYEEFTDLVNSLPLDEGRKSIILLTLGGANPRRLSKTKNNQAKEYINKAIANDKNKLNAVLERLGY
ncbi:MAG: hypothetical protein FD141_597 [Fusobacteria bacterium]|nr:MAG: hypothetical protein FD141_597 [Fusobacteriota bacterium]KAF0228737.1 MAG: hypothetical protein FD182_993 [Fusobacteriota bacterium]